MKTKSKILIVDDDEMTREIIGNILENAGYVVFKAADSMAAITYIKEVQLDLVLLDIILPDINGLELLNLMRMEYLEGKKVPVILISQLDAPEVISVAMKLGADDMITKPFDPAVLVEKISKYSN